MEARNHFTCITYDNVDFLIPSKYVVSGVYLDVQNDVKNIVFNRETLPHIFIGKLFEEHFLCKSLENYKVVLIMNRRDFAKDVCRRIVDCTNTEFPASGNLALSVNSSISSRIIDTAALRLLPQSIRTRQLECGVCAIGFTESGGIGRANAPLKKKILIAPDNLLRKFFSSGLIEEVTR